VRRKKKSAFKKVLDSSVVVDSTGDLTLDKVTRLVQTRTDRKTAVVVTSSVLGRRDQQPCQSLRVSEDESDVLG
jgi:hypothetical protein